ncbi:MAG: quercetin dioxygenase-like cupin family protein [Hyphomicrobiaceae bacterium]
MLPQLVFFTEVVMRDPDLQRLIDTTAAAFNARTTPGSPIVELNQHFFAAAAAETGMATPHDKIEPLPVCHHLAPALVTAATGSIETANVANALSHLMPHLHWSPRTPGRHDPEGFADNHANAVLVGNGGLEQRDDIRMGLSLIAPQTTYPNHQHPPEEIYLVLSPGEWRNDDIDWHEPGIGGVVHNPPEIVHAMRAGAAPLFALWCQWSS